MSNITKESAMLETYEAIIAKGLNTFLDVGGALMRIRDNRLYIETHETFEQYCQKKWGMSVRFAQMQMKAAKAAESINANNCSHEPETEAQVRPLTTLPESEQAEAWAEAVETAPRDADGKPKITGKHVAEVVAKRLREPAELEGPGNACDLPADHGTIETDDGVEWNREPPKPPSNVANLWRELQAKLDTFEAIFEKSAQDCDEARDVMADLDKLQERYGYYVRNVEGA
jgi:hypothetical protein